MLSAIDNRDCPVEGIGTRRFLVTTKDHFNKITLSDVSYNPKLRRNMLPGSRFENPHPIDSVKGHASLSPLAQQKQRKNKTKKKHRFTKYKKRFRKLCEVNKHFFVKLHVDEVAVWFGNSLNDHQARRRFVEWAQNEIAVVPDFHKRILFSDEAHFWLNGYVNKQNCRIWSEANPQVYIETPLHPEKLTVWCALWVGGILLQKR
ncbi:hypothetical protein TNCV_3459851 [Trichonephila clavipes]|nr:hypothetical protein TNCV_3459851 [Trichonephila clavipes]